MQEFQYVIFHDKKPSSYKTVNAVNMDKVKLGTQQPIMQTDYGLNTKCTKSVPSSKNGKFGSLRQVKVGLYSGDNKKCPKMIKDISEVKFPYLYEISLSGNNIESIEGLSRIDMPLISQVYLSKNRLEKGNNEISQMTNVRKAPWPNLNRI